MRISPLVMMGLVCAGACGDADDSRHLSADAALPDTAMPDMAVPTREVGIQVLDTPQFLMYRAGAGPWMEPERVSAQFYRVRATTTYDVVAAWVTAEGTQAALYHFADDEVPLIYRGLPGPTSPPPPRVEVSGRMLQTGAVYMRGDAAISTSAPWAYTLDVPSGTEAAALVAVGADRMLIRRGIDVSSPVALDAIDLASDGTPTVAKPLTLGNGPTVGETFSASLWWSGVGLPVSFATFRPPPASLVGSEVLQMTIEARTVRELRYCYGRYTDDRTSYTLPPALTGVSFMETGDIARATWGTLPPMMDGVALDVEAQTAEGLRLVTVEASPSWLATTGATSLAFDVSPPGFDPSWKIDLSGPYNRALVAWRNGVLPSNIDYLLSQVSEEAHGAVARPAAPRRLRDPMLRR